MGHKILCQAVFRQLDTNFGGVINDVYNEKEFSIKPF